ncbi:MAG TPA: choice-of-anchor D domain-containing protein [Candidatus Kapabacteria bacterium]|nr:choice-of-anchor D domain-containing protein [Candidatus Kapabacteria bacterium]
MLPFILFLLLISTGDSFAGWKKVFDFNGIIWGWTPSVRSMFFFDKDHGFVGCQADVGIFYTSDGGVSWTRTVTPDSLIGDITDIFMTDSLHGWASVEDKIDINCLWRTTDGGMSWIPVPDVYGDFTTVYETSVGVFLGSRGAGSGLNISPDGKYFYGTGVAEKHNHINFVDNIHGVSTTYSPIIRASNSVWTADGGTSWYTNNNNIEAWGVYAKKNTPTFILMGEKFADDPAYTFQTVEVSNDYGRTFSTISTFQGRTTGHISGVGDVIYVQSFFGAGQWFGTRNRGLYRSTDAGKTWTGVGGPSNDRDTRFWVTGCLGGVVYAGNEMGELFKTEDGGDGAINEKPRNPSISQPHTELLDVPFCNPATSSPFCLNVCCNTLIVDSIYFVDSSDEAISTGALSFTTKKVPFTLEPLTSESITFNWNPALLSSPKPLTTFLVNVHSRLPDSSMFFDTTLSIDISSALSQSTFSISDTLVHFDSLNICRRSDDTVFSFTNKGCDVLKLLDASVFGADFEVLMPDYSPITFPLIIDKDSSLELRVRYTPHGTGATGGNIKLSFVQYIPGAGIWLPKDTSISLAGSAYRQLTVFADPPVFLPPVSMCSTYDTIITLYNNSCDSLTIDSVLNSDGATFEVLTNLSLPVKIPGGSVLKIKVRFHPHKNSAATALFRYSYHIDEDSSVSVVRISGSGLPGNSFFGTTLSTNTITFADKVQCTPPDSISWQVFNPGGCDSVRIISATFTTSTPGTLSSSSLLPITLAPNTDYAKLTVYCFANIPGTYNGFYDIRYVTAIGDTVDTVITVAAKILPAAKVGTMNNLISNFGTMSLCNNRFDTIIIRNIGCPDLTVNTIALNGSNYTIISAPKTPFVLSQNQDTTAIIEFQSNSSGSHTANLTITTDDDQNPIKTIDYTASVNPIDQIGFRVEQVNKNLVTADTAMLEVIPDRDWQGKNLKAIDFELTYNGDLISFFGKTLSLSPSQPGVLVTVATLPNNNEQLTVSISSPTEIVLQKDKPFVRFYFTTALTDTVETSVQLSQLQLNHNDINYNTCILSPSTTDGDFSLQLVCGDKTIKDFMTGKPVLLAKAPRPNPLHVGEYPSVELPFTVSVAGDVSLSVVDVLGHVVHTETITATAGDYTFNVPGKILPSGDFSYTLTYNGVTHGVVRGRFVVLH